MKRWTRDEMAALDARWTAGETLAALGAEFGISGQRIRSLIAKSRRLALSDWMRANGWTAGPGGLWIDPPHPWPQYDKPTH